MLALSAQISRQREYSTILIYTYGEQGRREKESSDYNRSIKFTNEQVSDRGGIDIPSSFAKGSASRFRADRIRRGNSLCNNITSGLLKTTRTDPVKGTVQVSEFTARTSSLNKAEWPATMNRVPFVTCSY